MTLCARKQYRSKRTTDLKLDPPKACDGVGDAGAGDAGAGAGDGAGTGDARHPTVAHGKRWVCSPRHEGEPSPSGGRVPCAGVHASERARWSAAKNLDSRF